MDVTKSRLSFGDLQAELGRIIKGEGKLLGRSFLDRILRDWGRSLPEPEVVAGNRQWPADSLPAFIDVIRRDQECG